MCELILEIYRSILKFSIIVLAALFNYYLVDLSIKSQNTKSILNQNIFKIYHTYTNCKKSIKIFN